MPKIACPPQTQIRKEQGFQLIEALVAVLVLSLFLANVMDGLAKMHQQTTAPQNQALALTMCQELFDAARNQTFSSLAGAADGAWHQVLVNRTSPGQTAPGQPTYITSPLMLDLSAGNGASFSNQGQANLFRGTVEQRLDSSLTDGNLGAGQLRLSIRISWPIENSVAGNRTVQMSTLIYQNGIITR